MGKRKEGRGEEGLEGEEGWGKGKGHQGALLVLRMAFLERGIVMIKLGVWLSRVMFVEIWL